MFRPVTKLMHNAPAGLLPMERYVPKGLGGHVNVVPSTIDPPLLVIQVPRRDPWKDPLRVIDAYKLVKGESA